MSGLPSQGRLMSSHSNNSVLFQNDNDNDYKFQNQQHYDAKIFNTSFYRQKQLANQLKNKPSQGLHQKPTFVSLDFVKKYFQKNQIQQIVTKVMKTVLATDYLPENPFNMIYRLMMQQTLFQNAISYFANEGKSKRINANIKNKIYRNQNSKDSQAQQILTKRVLISNKEFFIGAQLAKYINANTLYILWEEFYSKARANAISQQVKRFRLKSFFFSMGGPLLINLEGVSSYSQKNDVIKLSLKVNEPIPLTAYTGDSMLELVYYIVGQNEDQNQQLTSFCNFIIQDSLQQMKNSSDQIYMFLTKFSIVSPQKQSITEWSSTQLIHQRNRIVKDIVKAMLVEKCQLKARYYMKSTKKIAAVLAEDYLTVTKTYVLIRSAVSESKMNITRKTTSKKSPIANQKLIYTSTPISFIFDQFFVVPDYYQHLDKIFNLNETANEVIFIEYIKQKYTKIIQQVKHHNMYQLSWQIFYISMYDRNISQAVNDSILESLNFILNSPLNFFTLIIHQLKVCKTLLNPNTSFTNNLSIDSENQMYRIVEIVEQTVYAYEKKGDFIYPEVSSYLQPIRKLTGVLLLKKRLKVNMAKLILDNLITMVRSLVNSYNSIAYILTGTLPQYIKQLDKSLGDQITKSVLTWNITYQIYLHKIKDFSKRTMYMPDQIKKYKQQLAATQNQTRDLIFARYLSQYRLYQTVYKFNWSLVQGKKLQFPLSSLMTIFKHKALNLQFNLIGNEIARLKQKNKNLTRQNISLNRVNGTEIYQISQGVNNQYLFYSLSQQTLKSSALPEYQKFHQKFVGYFRQDRNQNDNQLRRVKHIFSVKSLPFLNTFSQQTGGIYVAKFFVDVVIQPVVKKPQLYSLIYDQIINFMQKADKDQIGIIGIYSSWKNLSNSSLIYHGDSDQVYTWTSQQLSDIIKYDYKKKIPFEKLYKFLQTCFNYRKQIQVRVIYKESKVIQSCNVTFNFYYRQSEAYGMSQKSANDMMRSFVSISNYEDRVFYSSSQIVEWSVLNQISKKKQQKSVNQKAQQDKVNSNTSLDKSSPIKSKKIIKNQQPQIYGSLKKIYLQQQVLLQQLLIQDEDQVKLIASNSSYKQRLTIDLVRQYSPHYSKLEQSHHQMINLLYLIEYIKNDRRNRFQYFYLIAQVVLVQYYLVDQCLKEDKFIFLEGLSIEVINLVRLVKKYFQDHKDNFGQEKQLICLQKIVARASGLVKMLMQACALAVASAVKNKK